MSTPPAVRSPVDFTDLSQRIRATPLPPLDAVVAIGSGGIVPGCLIAHHLALDLHLLWLNYREPGTHRPLRPSPATLAPPPTLHPSHHRILLVDDVSVSGKTLAAAVSLLEGKQVTTFVLKGHADIVLFPELRTCANWPWSPPTSPLTPTPSPT